MKNILTPLILLLFANTAWAADKRTLLQSLQLLELAITTAYENQASLNPPAATFQAANLDERGVQVQYVTASGECRIEILRPYVDLDGNVVINDLPVPPSVPCKVK